MKKLYRKGTVHPSPPLVSDHLSFLPAAIFTLAVALSQEEKEVLAYLISCSSGEFSGNRRNTHKSTNSSKSPPVISEISSADAAVSAAVDGGGGGGSELSGDFSGNRGTTQFKSATPSSVSEKSGSGCSKGVAAVHGGGSGGGAENVFSGEFSGYRRTTQFKSATPSSVSENFGGGCSKGIAAVHGGVSCGSDHVTSFNCYCFSCYMSYWVKWDSSPNRQLIHEILDAYEDGLQSKKSNKKERRKQNGSSLKQNGSGSGSSNELKKSSSELSLNKKGSESGSGFGSGSGQTDPVEETSSGSGDGGGSDEEETGEKGSVRKFVSFLGEKIWSMWT